MICSSCPPACHCPSPDNSPLLSSLEHVYMSWFLLEFLLRLLTCPDRGRFLTGCLNMIDLVSLLPYLLSPLLAQLEAVQEVGQVPGAGGQVPGAGGQVPGAGGQVQEVGQVLRILRVVRVLKVARWAAWGTLWQTE